MFLLPFSTEHTSSRHILTSNRNNRRRVCLECAQAPFAYVCHQYEMAAPKSCRTEQKEGGRLACSSEARNSVYGFA